MLTWSFGPALQEPSVSRAAAAEAASVSAKPTRAKQLAGGRASSGLL